MNPFASHGLAQVDIAPLALADVAAVDVSPWYRALGRRMATQWLLKTVATAGGIGFFFPVYFWVMQQAAPRVRVMPLVFIDHWVALHDGALWLYASLWIYVSLPAAFGRDAKALLRYGAATGGMAAIAFAIFWLAPTAVPAFPIDWATHPSLQFLKSADAAGNAFPSLHVSFAVLACTVIANQLHAVGAPLWLRVANGVWAVGIVYSTLATRQHVALDVLGGLLLGGFCGAAFYIRSLERGPYE